MFSKILLISVDELWLRKKNRPIYVNAVQTHIKQVVSTHTNFSWTIKNDQMRFVLEGKEEFSQEVITALQRIPGLHSVTPAFLADRNIEDIIRVALLLWQGLSLTRSQKSFKVDASRSDKTFALNSMEIDKLIGEKILDHDPQARVDIHHPEQRLKIKISPEGVFLSIQSFKAIGGLPWGTSGHGLSLLSGGIDSPVASWMMFRRGLSLSFIFFHAYPYVGDEVKEKIKALVDLLAQHQLETRLFICPFGEIQAKISKECLETKHEQYRTILFRRFMIEASDLLAKRISAGILLTGDSLGQVSSQTLHNLSYLERASHIPIFRPLIGLNKLEIMSYAKQIGTFEISQRPHDDACALFAPKHPVTKPDWNYWESFDNRADIHQLLQQALEKTECWRWKGKGPGQLLT